MTLEEATNRKDRDVGKTLPLIVQLPQIYAGSGEGWP